MDLSKHLKRQVDTISASQGHRLLDSFMNPLAAQLQRQNEQFGRIAELLSPTKAVADELSKLTSQNLAFAGLTDLSRVALPTIDLSGLESMNSSISWDISRFGQSLAESMVKLTINWAEMFDELNPYMAKAAVLFAKHGWWIVDALPVSIYVKLVKREDTITEPTLTDLIVRFANRNKGQDLVEMVEGWNVTAFKRREVIFRDALWAHKRKKYTLTVPALIPHLEGIVREVVGSSKRARNGFKVVQNKFRNRFKQASSAPLGHRVTYDEVRALENFYNLGALEQIYRRFTPVPAAKLALNRHGIAHGLWLDYGSIQASTKILLLFDMLHSMLQQLERK